MRNLSFIFANIVAGFFSARPVLVLVLLYFFAASTRAPANNWNPAVPNGNWNAAGNWIGGLPSAGAEARIEFNNVVDHTIALDTSTPSLSSLIVDNTGGGRTFLNIPSNTLTTTGFIVGLNSNGRGTVNQTGGTVAMTGALDSVLGSNASAEGVYNLSAGSLSVARDLYVGGSGKGTYNQSGGTATMGSRVIVTGSSRFAQTGGTFTATSGANFAPAASANTGVTISGADTTFNAGGTSTWGGSGAAAVDVSGGATVHLNHLNVAVAGGNGTLTVADSTVTAANVSLGGNGGTGRIELSGGSTFTQSAVSTLQIGQAGAAGNSSRLTVNSGSTYSAGSGNTSLFTTGEIRLLGGTFTTGGNVLVGAELSNDPAKISLVAPGSQFLQTGSGGVTLTGNVSNNSSLVVVNPQTTFTAGTGGINISLGGVFQLQGGTVISGGNIATSGGFAFSSGTLSYVGNLSIDSSGILGANPTLAANRSVTLTGTTTVPVSQLLTIAGGTLNTGSLVVRGGLALTSGTLTTTSTDVQGSFNLSGGTLSTGSITSQGSFFFSSGRLAITGPGGLTIGPGGFFGNNLTLSSVHDLNVAQTATITAGSVLTVNPGGNFSAGNLANAGEFIVNGDAGGTVFTNTGLLRGVGRVSGAVTNAASGVVRVSSGEVLTFAGASFTNQGRVEAIGNSANFTELRFTSPVTNTAASGLMAGLNSIWRFQNGMTNEASFTLTTSNNIVFGDINNNAEGTISLTGGASATFFDDIVQNGTFRVNKAGSTTSVAVVLGTFSGSGGSTGGGDIFFEGGLRPGNGPATVTYDNNIAFGSGATLEIELGGTIGGSEYDQVRVSGSLSLAGKLAVTLINGFTPQLGQSFDILDWSAQTGTFNSLQLPALAAGRQWNTSQLYATGVLSVVSGGLAGDYNNDGTVNAADYTVYRNRKAGIGGTTLPNDAGAAGVTIEDYNYWKVHYGGTHQGGSSFSLQAASAPEPATLGLATLAYCALLSLRRRWTLAINVKLRPPACVAPQIGAVLKHARIVPPRPKDL